MKYIVQWPTEFGTQHVEMDSRKLPMAGDRIAVQHGEGPITWLGVICKSHCPDDLTIVHAHKSHDEMQTAMDELYSLALQFEGMTGVAHG
jgi:hypothetical protein